jgi:hypothetical protein
VTNFARVETTIACGGATTVEALPELKKMGFNSVINLRQASEQGGTLTVRWDAARHPYLTVSHLAGVRTVIGLDLQGGSASVPTAALPAGGRFEFGLSDGVNTQRLAIPR